MNSKLQKNQYINDLKCKQLEPKLLILALFPKKRTFQFYVKKEKCNFKGFEDFDKMQKRR